MGYLTRKNGDVLGCFWFKSEQRGDLHLYITNHSGLWMG